MPTETSGQLPSAYNWSSHKWGMRRPTETTLAKTSIDSDPKFSNISPRFVAVVAVGSSRKIQIPTCRL